MTKDNTEQHRTREFKPLPSDIIQDPGMWPEWKLDDKMKVVKKNEDR